MPTFGSLFAGIGGIDLGLERAGWTCRFQVEWDEWCQRVLAKHWPDVPRYGDISTVDWSGVERVDLLAGGFPCQPFSVAGKRRGKSDDRWLWPEFARAIGALRPGLVLVENVPGLLAGHGGMGSVLGDLAALGYDARWDCIPAAAVGASHLRYRIWIVAHARRLGSERRGDAGDVVREGGGPEGEARQRERPRGSAGDSGAGWTGLPGHAPDADGNEHQGGPSQDRRSPATELLADAGGYGGTERLAGPNPWQEGDAGKSLDGRDASGWSVEWSAVGNSDGSSPDAHAEGRGPWGAASQSGWWATEPDVGRVAHGVPSRVDRLRGLGNAVVPQVVEVIGRRLLEAEALT